MMEKKETEETIKKGRIDFMLDRRTLIARSATNPELNRVGDGVRRGDQNTAPKLNRLAFEKLANIRCLIFNDVMISWKLSISVTPGQGS